MMEHNTTITKQKIANHIHNKIGFAKSVTEKLVSQIFDEISDILKAAGTIQLPNFGSFSLVMKKERPAMNMYTRERIILPAREVVRFVPSRSLKNRVNNG